MSPSEPFASVVNGLEVIPRCNKHHQVLCEFCNMENINRWFAVTIAIIALLVIGAFIGQSQWGKEVLHLTVENVANKATADVRVVEAKSETKVTIAEDKLNYQKQIADKASAELETAKAEAKKAETEKNQAIIDGLKTEVERLRMELNRVTIVSKQSETVIVDPISIPAQTVTRVVSQVEAPRENVREIRLVSEQPKGTYPKNGVERPLSVEFRHYASKARADAENQPKYRGITLAYASVYDKIASGQKLTEQERDMVKRSLAGLVAHGETRDANNFRKALEIDSRL